MADDIKLHFEFMLGHAAYSVISSLITYKIAEHLLAGPKSVEELAILASVDSTRLFQYLRLASHYGVFVYDSNSKNWSNTPKSIQLTSSISRGLWEWQASPFVLDLYVHATALLSSDKEPHVIKNTPPLFETMSKNIDLLIKFQTCMTEASAFNMNEIIQNIDLGESQKVLDVGGADGTLVLGLAKKHVNISVGILDRPEVEPIANKNIIDNGLGEKAVYHGGNFLESVTEGYDCIVMKHIIHDWNDEKARIILKNCRKALKEGNKLFVVDQVIDKDSEYYITNLACDNLMLLTFGSKERTLEEFGNLFNECGFRLHSAKNTLFEAVIEAVAV